MHVFRALLLSSRKQAEYYEGERMGLFSIGVKYYYYLLVTHMPEGDNESDAEKWALGIYRVTYPDQKEGQGLGARHRAIKPHETTEFSGKDRLYNHLRRYSFNPDNGWTPVEEGG